MNVEIGAEATQFPEKEYISGIFVAVWRWEETWWTEWEGTCKRGVGKDLLEGVWGKEPARGGGKGPAGGGVGQGTCKGGWEGACRRGAGDRTY
jgi:hypothetical protein